jgi:ABC-type amino acid transport substrate-binding protein
MSVKPNGLIQLGWLVPLLVVLLQGCAQPVKQPMAMASRLDQILLAGKMRVGVAADAPPFAFIDRQGERQGFDIELMNEIARRLGVEVTWVDAAYQQLPIQVEKDKLDAAIGAVACAAEWNEQVDFSRAYHHTDAGSLCIALPKGERVLVEEINNILADLNEEGFIAQKWRESLAPR